ncbi:MAG: elongation factor Ts [Alphaproteobacteria bacterium]|nr:elongation factor Ts [Alphaproteobacteria bacterium]|tara:strand:+ start:127 stop:1047 length:921 start_codon:yes stop_codon:yes gene_type:complete
MADITAAAVKELREKSGAGMMDCKTALTECDGDMEAAVDWLRKKGLSAAAKKAGRAAAEGLVGMVVEGGTGALVEVNAETDFVARNETFQEFVTNVAKLALTHSGDDEALKAAAYEGGGSVDEAVVDLVAKIGENIGYRRSASLSVDAGVVCGYVHNQVSAGLGKIGVLVALESAGEAGKLEELGRQLAMHVAAAQPQYLDVASVDTSALEREREVLADQARASGKPEEIVEKMVEGRLRKFYEEVVLSEQTYVIDGETKVSKVVEAAAKEIGVPVAIAGFTCFTLGEGIERREDDFADEVAKLAN